MTKNKLIYLDYAAATPLDERIKLAMEPFFKDLFYNPSASYSQGLKAKQALEQARSKVAQTIGAKASEVNFTAGGSEANNLAIHGLMREFPAANLVISALEHDSILKPAANYNHKICPVNNDGQLDITKLKRLIDEQTVLVSIMYVNNEIGTIEPLQSVAKLVADISLKRLASGNKLPLYVHSDACQAANYLDTHVSRLGVDLMTLNGGKIYGPKQSGVLFIKAGIRLRPLIDGGGQEHGLRSGTESLASAVGMAEALQLAQASRKEESSRLEGLRDYFIDELIRLKPQAIINGSLKKRIANNVHFTLPGVDNETLLIKLDEAGILAAAGSACSASSEEPSHVLRAIGLSEPMARSSIRMTLGRSTSLSDIQQTLKILGRIS